MATDAESKTYTGGCHCGENRYTTTISPPLESEKSTVINCNCSICNKNAYLFTFVDDEPDKFKWEKGGTDKMTSYKFGKGSIGHNFCSTCGTSIVGIGTMGGVTKVAINVRTIDDVDVTKLKTMEYDGKSL